MITFSTVKEWQDWFDSTFPGGVRVTSRFGAWEIVPRVLVVEEVSDGSVRFVCNPWNYSRMYSGRLKAISPETSASYAYTQYVTDPPAGFALVIFSGDVAAADAAVVAERRETAIEKGTF